MSDILKNGHKGWSEADLTQEPRFLPGWLPQKPLETLGFICKWSPLRTKGFNRKSNEQNWWVSLSQIGPSHCSEKRFPGPRTILIQLPWGRQAAHLPGFPLPSSAPPAATVALGRGASALRKRGVLLVLVCVCWGSTKSQVVHLVTLRTSKEDICFFLFWTGCSTPQPKACPELFFLSAYKCTCV